MAARLGVVFVSCPTCDLPIPVDLDAGEGHLGADNSMVVVLTPRLDEAVAAHVCRP